MSALISSILTCFDGFSFGLSDLTDNICPSLAYDPGGKSNPSNDLVMRSPGFGRLHNIRQ